LQGENHAGRTRRDLPDVPPWWEGTACSRSSNERHSTYSPPFSIAQEIKTGKWQFQAAPGRRDKR
jgi:hypothetical protein